MILVPKDFGLHPQLFPLNREIREYVSGNLRKNWSQGYCVQTDNFAYFCPKSAVKSRKGTRNIFSTITISLGKILKKNLKTDYRISMNHRNNI